MPDGVNPEVARKSASIARQTMSPFCPGRTLADCPSPSAAEWRKDIEVMVAEGRQAPEIQEILSERAAHDLSGRPQKDVSYAVPIALVLLSVLLLGFIFFRLRGAKVRASDPSRPAESRGGADDLEARLDEELDRVS